MADVFTIFGLLTILLTLLVALFWYKCLYKQFEYFRSQGIPGPKPLPLVGNFFLFSKFKGNGVAINEHLIKTYGPVSGVYMGHKASMCVADLDMLRDILIKQFDKFSDRITISGLTTVRVDNQLVSGLFSSRSESWRRRRHILTPAFSGRKMKLMEPLIKESIDRMSQKVSTSALNGNPIDVVDLYRKMTMEVILSTAFGRSVDVQTTDGGELYKAAGTLFSVLDPSKQSFWIRMVGLIVVLLPQSVISPMEMTGNCGGIGQSLNFLASSVLEILKLRRQQGEENKRVDLLQLMIDASDEDTKSKLTNGEIVADCVEFLLAGYETTGTALTFLTYQLATHPDVQDRLFTEVEDYFQENEDVSMYDATHELEYLDMVLSETLRMYPPLPVTYRTCTESCQIKDLNMKKGVMVFVPTHYIHHNPELWSSPEEFNPERFTAEEKAKRHPCAYLPFGLGPRNCVGMRFALMEAKMALIEIVRNFKIELAPETKIPPEVNIGPMLRPSGSVQIVFLARNTN